MRKSSKPNFARGGSKSRQDKFRSFNKALKISKPSKKFFRFKLFIEYEGTRYSGWQRQENAKTIQGTIIKAANEIFGNDFVDLQGSGRTDSGVHALCQIAHLDVNTVLAPEIIRMKLNDLLPHDINILEVEKASQNFHARHDAKSRSYLYQIPDEFVTEIEAWGTDEISQGKITETNDFFNQGINLIANLRPMPKLNFSFNYFLNRSDQNLVSIWNSVSGAFSNLVSDSISDDDDLRSNILRTYGATTTWYTHRLLTTTLRLQRNEAFDNMDETDFSSNTYTLSFNSVPLPSLDTNLSFIRSDNYNFGKKETTNDSVLFSILSRLYRDVNMVTDMFYTRSKSYVTDSTSNTSSIRGSINATLTQKLYGSLIYELELDIY